MPVRVDVSLLSSELRVVLGQLMRRLRAEHRFPLTHGAVLGRLDRQGPLSTAELACAERVRQQSMGQTLAEDRGRREGWLAQAIEQGFSGEEQEVLAQAIPLLARLTEL